MTVSVVSGGVPPAGMVDGALLAWVLGHWVLDVELDQMLLACVLSTISSPPATCDSLSLLWLRYLPVTAMFVGLPGRFLGGGVTAALGVGDRSLLLLLLATILNPSAPRVAYEAYACLILAV